MVQSSLNLARTKTFKIHSELATELGKNLPVVPSNFNSGTTKDCYTGISDNRKNEFLLIKVSEDVVKKYLFCLNVNNAAGMDQFTAKFLKESCRCVSLTTV